MVDTSLFDPEFGARLVSVLSNQSNLDEQTDGLLIHADNFQALNLLQTRYRSQVKCIYIDPPYNTGGDGFIYKDNYQHSSWATCIENRIKASYPFIKYDGVFSISADDNEQANLKQICNYLFGQENFIAQTIWERAYSPVNLKKHFSESHDYLLFFAKNISNLKCNGIPRSDDGSNRYSNPDNDPRGNWKSSDLSVGPAVQENIYPITTPSGRIVLPPNGYSWRLSKTRFDEYVQDNRIWFGKNGNNVPSIKRFLSEVKSTVTPMTIWKYQNVGHSQSASQDLKNMFGEARFTYPKSVPLIQQAIGLYSERNSLILDYFAGSGTTAHAVINLNREDGGKRKYILVEQGEYFNTVLKPRIQKAVYAAEWKDGKPVADGEGRLKGVSQAVKVLKLESYEDTLNNLQLARPADLADMGRQPENLKQEYLLHYMLNVESRGSLLSTDAFKKPFDYRMNIAADSAGATKETRVDLVETFNYLLGLTVDAVDDKRFSHGYVLIEGYLKNPSERVLIVWRDCEKWDYDTLPKLLDKKKILAEDSEFTEIYINGDHTLPTVFQDDDADGGAQRTLKIQSIDETFLRLMFEGA